MENEEYFKQNGATHTSEYTPLSNDLDALRAELIRAGGNPRSKQFKAKEAAAQRAAQERIEEEYQRRDAMRPQWSKSLSNFVSRALSFIAVLFVVVTVLLGVLGVSILMVVAEVAVIRDGIAAVTETNSWLYAHALVLLYLVLLFIREIIGYDPATAPTTAREMFSLKHVSSWLRYFFGGNNWTPRLKQQRSLLDSASLTVKWLMLSVLLFGVLGRLAPKLASLDGSWYDALKHIVSSSTLSEMLGYIATISISGGLMLGVHFIVHWVFREYAKLTGGVQTQDFFGGFNPGYIEEREMILLYQDEILRLQTRRQNNLPPPTDAAMN